VSIEKKGLCISLSEEFPTIIKIGGQELRIYAHRLKCGSYRARFVGDESITIISPNRVKKGWIHGLVKEVIQET
jgi:hypothetical protein